MHRSKALVEMIQKSDYMYRFTKKTSFNDENHHHRERSLIWKKVVMKSEKFSFTFLANFELLIVLV